ncbi:MAG: hypothetical protein HY700_09570 [Gemmatimonadetes bacterium]|nr:hypothetical protein [Gemmatimonadota bacterium]
MREEFVALLFVFAISLTANVALAIAWWRSGRRVRELETRDLQPGPVVDDRTERLERSVESLASQIDQLASGQEFLNRLVAERLIRSASAPDRPITPH